MKCSKSILTSWVGDGLGLPEGESVGVEVIGWKEKTLRTGYSKKHCTKMIMNTIVSYPFWWGQSWLNRRRMERTQGRLYKEEKEWEIYERFLCARYGSILLTSPLGDLLGCFVGYVHECKRSTKSWIIQEHEQFERTTHTLCWPHSRGHISRTVGRSSCRIERWTWCHTIVERAA